MAKPSPEKLAQALRANLKRRKQVRAKTQAPQPAEPASKTVKKPGFP